MGIRTYFHYVKQIRFLKKTMKRCHPYLKNGTYMLFPSMRALACTAGDSVENAKKYFIHHTKKKTNRVIEYANKHAIFKNKKGNGLFEAIYIANNFDKKREVKLFSFQDHKILTLCVSEEENQNQLAEYEQLHNVYGMPKVTRSSLFPHAHDISMVALSERPSESKVLEEILAATVKFNPEIAALSHAETEQFLSLGYDNAEMNSILAKLKEQINSEGLPESFPLCLQHGDLSQDNLMYGTADGVTGFYWIDWEHKRERIFFYDFFFYILNSAYCSDITAPLTAYTSGACDELLKEYFNHFGLTYDPGRKKDYFLIFLIFFVKERLGTSAHLPALKSYTEYLASIFF